ncbi:class I SAM-dependent methyltransferase [Aeromicrobium terrae]|uniref:Class I SAM-dependent methyltransferase n=1 Tax=Aeromicrobium terrae TaxID=2498846 RepID=A0A5C8NHT2_9ACTN|nr:class I SAM-dependent methyltransferase [Aeromicrobium terrae]TXL61444.1 class I SAM-dependent methyltransferase [Aeromicrobium terrae]
MPESDSVFTGSIPHVYERLMVPMIFAEPADSLAEIVAARRPGRILETAAGTGVVTRRLLAACPDAEIVATDLNQPMLDRAAELIGDEPRVTYQQADALDLPFDDASFDVVTCQFGVMFFPDRRGGFREAGRVLRPGGAFVFNTWDSFATNDFARIIAAALNRVAPGPPLDFMERTPHGYFDLARIRDDVEAAGLRIESLEPVMGTSTAEVGDAAAAYCQGTPWRAEVEALSGLSLEDATAVARDALVAEYGEGEISGRTGWFEVVAVPET